jgi:hypothetical protein
MRNKYLIKKIIPNPKNINIKDIKIVPREVAILRSNSNEGILKKTGLGFTSFTQVLNRGLDTIEHDCMFF